MIAPSWQNYPANAADGSSAQVTLHGDWTLAALGDDYRRVQKNLRNATAGVAVWDLTGIHRLDGAGALLLLAVWGERRPAGLRLDAEAERVLQRIENAPPAPAKRNGGMLEMLSGLGQKLINARKIGVGMVELTGRLLLDSLYLMAHPREVPLREFTAAVYKAAVLTLPITGLLGFLVGMVMSYLLALQLRNFGADTLIVDVLGYGIAREFGPVMMAILVAGRSGASMTAQLGLMRVTEEIDALATMGVSRTQRLVLPKVAALAICGPLLALWSGMSALAGGIMVAYLQLDIDVTYFINTLPTVVPFGTIWIGLMKGGVFCTLIGIVACYLGLDTRPNTESLAARTTLSVVLSITAVIIADSAIAIMTGDIGVPYK